MTVPWLLQVSHETSVGPHAVKSCQGWTCHGGLKYGNHLFAFCTCGLVKDKTKQESHYHKALTKPLVFICGYTPYTAILYSRVMWFARLGQQNHTANTEVLVGNVKSPNGRDPVTIDCLPPKPWHLIYWIMEITNAAVSVHWEDCIKLSQQLLVIWDKNLYSESKL